ncbi:MAG: transposase, partial [Actinobacteria bacterium]|nr:transposase [Actinomycetota bacterium]
MPDRDGDGKDELICLITTLADSRAAPAQALADTYHERWAHATGNKQLKTYLRGPGRVLRSTRPEADIEPDRVKV